MYSVEVLSLESGYGFAIDLKGQRWVLQTHIAGAPGYEPYPTEAAAQAGAQLVIDRHQAMLAEPPPEEPPQEPPAE